MRVRRHHSILARRIRSGADAYELFTPFSQSSYCDASYGSDMDIFFLALTLTFFAVSVGYVAACDRLMK
jgi:hypothetical protein